MTDKHTDITRLREIADLIPALFKERLGIWKRRREAKDTTLEELAKASNVKSRANVKEALDRGRTDL
jgi:hypothetical protein